MICLPDVNVWIALAAERHVPHPRARLWFRELHDVRAAFCRITQLGFLRLLTNPHVMKEEVLTPDEAWRTYQSFRDNPLVGFIREPESMPEMWNAFMPQQPKSPNMWTDAFLCAIAASWDATLVSFDGRIPLSAGVRRVVPRG